MPRNSARDKSPLKHVNSSFRKQGIMRLLDARITRLEKGLVEISARNRPDLSQQDGFVHAGAMATLADSAGGYAALSLLPRDYRVLSVEFKLNFTRPASGDVIRGRGRVKKMGRTIAVVELEVETRTGGKWESCAWGSQTVFCTNNPGIRQRKNRPFHPLISDLDPVLAKP